MNYELTEGSPDGKKQEFAFYLAKLKRLHLIKYDEDRAFICGGFRHPKYKNNVVMIWGEYIHLTSLGIKLVEDAKKSATEQFKEKEIGGTSREGEADKDEFNELFVKSMDEYLKRISEKR